MDRTIKELETNIGENDWEAARRATVRLKYWLGIESAAKEWGHS
jgi:HSCB C-terminal oligomerisation domain